MIMGVHALMYGKDAAAARAFLRDVLEMPAVDAGGGWLIFAGPPLEMGVHPAEGEPERHELHFMCDDVKKTVAALKKKGVRFTGPIVDRGYGLVTGFEVPGAGVVGLYEARHPVAIGMKTRRSGAGRARSASRSKSGRSTGKAKR